MCEVSIFMRRTKIIAAMAMLTAIGVVVNIITYPSVTYFGRMSLVYCFCFLAGIWLGPVKGCIVAMLADIIQVVFFAQPGPFVPQITISNGLLAAIMGLMFKTKLKNLNLKVAIGGIICLFVCSAGISAHGEAMFLFNVYPYTFAKSLGASLNITSPYLMVALSKLITQSFWIALNCFLTVMIYLSTRTVVDAFIL